MSSPSSWPLTEEAVRILIGSEFLKELASNKLTKACFPTAVGYYPNASEHFMERIRHDDYILIYCEKGLGELDTCDTKYQIQRGDLFILPPNHPHTYRSYIKDPWTIFWCHFKGKEAACLYENIESLGDNLVVKIEDIQIRSIFKELLSMASAIHERNALVHLCKTLGYLLTRIERRVMTDKRDLNSKITQVQRYMRENISKKISLEELAKLCGLTKYYFTHKYKEVTGMSPLRHFQAIKMEHACFLLEQSKKSVSEVADATGFEDALYFSRCFKKHYGLSPSKYRKGLNELE